MSEADEIQFAQDNKVELTLHHMRRADESATVLRGVVLTIAVAVGAFIAEAHKEQLAAHAFPLSALIVCVSLLFWSWHRQKSKSLQRAKHLKSGNFEAYVSVGNNDGSQTNEKIDMFAMVSFVIGISAEVFLRWIATF